MRSGTWALLPTAIENAYNMTGAFDFTQQPRPPLMLPGRFTPDHYPLTQSNSTNTLPDSQLATQPLTIASLGITAVLVIAVVALVLIYWTRFKKRNSQHSTKR